MNRRTPQKSLKIVIYENKIFSIITKKENMCDHNNTTEK